MIIKIQMLLFSKQRDGVDMISQLTSLIAREGQFLFVEEISLLYLIVAVLFMLLQLTKNYFGIRHICFSLFDISHSIFYYLNTYSSGSRFQKIKEYYTMVSCGNNLVTIFARNLKATFKYPRDCRDQLIDIVEPAKLLTDSSLKPRQGSQLAEIMKDLKIDDNPVIRILKTRTDIKAEE